MEFLVKEEDEEEDDDDGKSEDGYEQEEGKSLNIVFVWFH